MNSDYTTTRPNSHDDLRSKAEKRGTLKKRGTLLLTLPLSGLDSIQSGQGGP